MFGDDGRVSAVLDWELSTLGHPLADLAYSAMAYHLPAGTPALPSLPEPLPPGAALLQCACKETSRLNVVGLPSATATTATSLSK